MTQRVLSQSAMRELLDRLSEGYMIREAAESIGLREGGFWTWKKKSRDAEQECDFTQYWIENWKGRTNFFHVLVGIAMKPHRTPLPEVPPYSKGVYTPAPTDTDPRVLAPFPPTPTPASPRARPESPLIADLRARAKIPPQHPFPLDARGNRTIPKFDTSSSKNDPEERVTGASYER